jgi:hypothetical protein
MDVKRDSSEEGYRRGMGHRQKGLERDSRRGEGNNQTISRNSQTGTIVTGDSMLKLYLLVLP